MNFAVIENNVVVNTIVAESKSVAEEFTGLTCVALSDSLRASIGWVYNGRTFTDPNPPTPLTKDQ
jgi:hypothetical protein